jgi:septum site-determining protein MinD
MTRIIAVVSGKGGVGKTTCVANLGSALTKLGKDTILVDGNLTTPNLSLHLGIPFFPTTIHDVLKDRASLNHVIFLHHTGLKIIPASLSLSAVKSAVNYKRFKTFLNELVGKTDYVIVDSSPGLGKETRSVIEATNEVLIVTNPELPAVTDALKVVKLAEESGSEITGIIVNRVKRKPHELSDKEIETIIEYPVIGTVPEDEHVQRSISKKMPVVHYHPKTKASIAFKKIAAKIAGEKLVEKKGFWEYILDLFR